MPGFRTLALKRMAFPPSFFLLLFSSSLPFYLMDPCTTPYGVLVDVGFGCQGLVSFKSSFKYLNRFTGCMYSVWVDAISALGMLARVAAFAFTFPYIKQPSRPVMESMFCIYWHCHIIDFGPAPSNVIRPPNMELPKKVPCAQSTSKALRLLRHSCL